MVDLLRIIQQELPHLLDDIDSNLREQPVALRISTIISRCIEDTQQALEETSELRSMHEQFLFMRASTTPADARSLILNIHRLAGMVVHSVSSIKKSLEDINSHSESLRTPARSRAWRVRLSDQIGALQSLTEAIQGSISSMNQPLRRQTHPRITTMDASSSSAMILYPMPTNMPMMSWERPLSPTYGTYFPPTGAFWFMPEAHMAPPRSFDAHLASVDKVYTSTRRNNLVADVSVAPTKISSTLINATSDGLQLSHTAALEDSIDWDSAPEGASHLSSSMQLDHDDASSASTDGSFVSADDGNAPKAPTDLSHTTPDLEKQQPRLGLRRFALAALARSKLCA
ncbi:hypothetical protein FRC09_009135 [Ceratobasidium sp. 395]|nr:hypothetical protein FRC09_009135 [Ceratobasidium sp. 395]